MVVTSAKWSGTWELSVTFTLCMYDFKLSGRQSYDNAVTDKGKPRGRKKLFSHSLSHSQSVLAVEIT